MKKRLSAALAGSLVLGMLCVPMGAFADEDTITVTVSAYDYTAVEAGIATASGNGIILDQYSVEVPSGTTDVEAIQKAFEDNGISITVSESYYGGYYVSAINGLSEYSNPEAEPDYSGWMMEYNNDNFTNWGIGTLGEAGDGVLRDGDSIEFHYTVDAYADLTLFHIPIVSALTVGGQTITMDETIDYDENWNTVHTFTVNGEKITADGSAENPFVLEYDLGEVESSVAEISYELFSDYVSVSGIEESHDFAEPLSFHVITKGGKTSYYTVYANYTLIPEETDAPKDEDNKAEDELKDSEDQSVPAGDAASAGLLFAAVAAAFAAAVVSRKAEEA